MIIDFLNILTLIFDFCNAMLLLGFQNKAQIFGLNQKSKFWTKFDKTSQLSNYNEYIFENNFYSLPQLCACPEIRVHVFTNHRPPAKGKIKRKCSQGNSVWVMEILHRCVMKNKKGYEYQIDFRYSYECGTKGPQMRYRLRVNLCWVIKQYIVQVVECWICEC